MSLVRTNGTTTKVSRDPYSLARELLGWDPFFSGRPASAFSPAFEVKETSDSFVLKADVPGVDEKDLDVAVHNGVLTVSGSRSAEERREGESYAIYERQFGSFSRSFALPDFEAPVLVVPKHGEPEDYRAGVDTIVFEPEMERFTMSWRVRRPLRKNMFEIARVLVGRKGREWWQQKGVVAFPIPIVAVPFHA